MTENRQFDHHSALAAEDQVGYYESFRETCPVGRSDEHDGFVYITRYDDVFRVARNDELFSSSRASMGGREGTAIVIPSGPGLDDFQFPLELDPPDSFEYRNLLNPLLTERAVEKMKPMIKAHATRIVDEFIESGSTDFVRDLTNPLPSCVTLDWLGFPEEDWARIGVPVHLIFSSLPGSERLQRGGEGLAYMEQRIRELIRQRRAEPGDDALSWAVHQKKTDGTEFTEAEVLSTIGLLVAGGVDTTTSLTGSVLVHLSQNPEQRQKLLEAPDLLEAATEEFLRVFAPTTSMARTSTADTEISGCPVKAGERILLPWVAANHDPDVFPNPREVQLDRDATRHLAFGTGSHRCPGSHLARAMFHEMINQVLTRMPDYQVIDEGLVGYPSRGTASGWDEIPATFTPGKRSQDGSLGSLAIPARADWADLTVTEVVDAASDVVKISLADPTGAELSGWKPGAHLELRLPSGRLRQYSLCGDPADTSTYTVAVLREPAGRGGSVELHDIAKIGVELTVRPRNHFPLVEADSYLFLAGGIGVTPIVAMVRAVVEQGKDVTVVYGGRSRASMAFVDELQQLAPEQVTIVPQDEIAGLLDLRGALGGISEGTAVYCCGPSAMISATEQVCTELGIDSRLHIERFTAGDDFDVVFDPENNTAFDVQLARTGVTLHVPADKRIIEVAREVLPDLSYDCEKGFCGACETRVIAGAPDHLDSILSKEERESGTCMMICVSRTKDERLVLDL